MGCKESRCGHKLIFSSGRQSHFLASGEEGVVVVVPTRNCKERFLTRIKHGLVGCIDQGSPSCSDQKLISSVIQALFLGNEGGQCLSQFNYTVGGRVVGVSFTVGFFDFHPQGFRDRENGRVEIANREVENLSSIRDLFFDFGREFYNL